MEVSQLINLIVNNGFAVAVSAYLLIRLEKQIIGLSNSINKLNTIISTKLGVVIDNDGSSDDSHKVAWEKVIDIFLMFIAFKIVNITNKHSFACHYSFLFHGYLFYFPHAFVLIPNIFIMWIHLYEVNAIMNIFTFHCLHSYELLIKYSWEMI